MDCFAVAIATGFSNKQLKLNFFLVIALIFGAAHFIMPLSGWLIGDAFKFYIKSYDHWVAFGLLFIIGTKMLLESTKEKNIKSFTFETTALVLLLTIATSIDALIVGMSLAFLDFNLFISVTIISFCAFIISFIGFIIGKKFGNYFGSKAEIIGGIILIVLGIKILSEHLFNNI